jgi:hypothetical protein
VKLLFGVCGGEFCDLGILSDSDFQLQITSNPMCDLASLLASTWDRPLKLGCQLLDCIAALKLRTKQCRYSVRL